MIDRKLEKRVSFTSVDDRLRSEFDDALSFYKDFHHPVLFAGGSPNINDACLMKPRFLSGGDTCVVANISEETKFNSIAKAEVMHQINRAYFNETRLLCPNRDCLLLTPQGNLIYFDAHHLTADGATLLVPQLLQAFQALLASANRSAPAMARSG